MGQSLSWIPQPPSIAHEAHPFKVLKMLPGRSKIFAKTTQVFAKT
jgi:hypothetical protein